MLHLCIVTICVRVCECVCSSVYNQREGEGERQREVTAASLLSIIINLCARELVCLSLRLPVGLSACLSVCVCVRALVCVKIWYVLFIYLFFGLRHFTAISWANSAYACSAVLCPVMLWLFALNCSVNCAYDLDYKSKLQLLTHICASCPSWRESQSSSD